MSAARVVACKWCRTVTIYPGRADDHVTVSVAGDVHAAIVNAEPVPVLDGICEACRQKRFPLCPHCRHPHHGHVCRTPIPTAAPPSICGCTHEYQAVTP